MGDEPREPGAEGREERDEPQAGEARENKPGGVISIIQQNAVISRARRAGRRKPFDRRRDVGDEPREPGAKGREERDEPEAGDAREKKPGGVISIIQQNAVIINGRSESRRERKEEWI